MSIDSIYYNLDSLYLMTTLILMIGTVFLFSYTRNILLSISISFIKAIVFFIFYFLFFNETDFTLPDSITYIENTKYLVENITIDRFYNELDKFWSVAGGRHIFYYIYSYFLCKIFGVYYFVPVAFNIIITYFGAYIIFKIGLLIGINKKLSVGLSIFYLLHWDIMAWSVFNNLRDILISTLVLFIIYIMIKLINKLKFFDIVLLILSLWILNYLRFYFIVFTIATCLIYYAIYHINYFKYYFNKKQRIIPNMLLLITLFGFFCVFYYYYKGSFEIWIAYAVNPIYGMIRFFLTPIPFYQLYNGYGFLHFASMLHWLTLPILLFGWYKLYYLNKNLFIFISIFIVINIVFFGVFGPVQGPRHRLPMVPFLIIFQYIGFVYLLQRYKSGKKSSNFN